MLQKFKWLGIPNLMTLIQNPLFREIDENVTPLIMLQTARLNIVSVSVAMRPNNYQEPLLKCLAFVDYTFVMLTLFYYVKAFL